MLPIPANIKLVVLVVLTGVIAAVQLLVKLEPSIAWLPGLCQLLVFLEGFFTLPQSAQDKMRALAKGPIALLLVAGSLGLIVATQGACAQVVPAIVPVASCVTSVVSDALQGMSISQIVAAAGPGCVTDADDVIAILLGSGDPRVHSTRAYGEARAARAATQSLRDPASTAAGVLAAVTQ